MRMTQRALRARQKLARGVKLRAAPGSFLLLCFLTGCIHVPFSKIEPNNISLTAADSPLPGNAFSATIELAYPAPTNLKAGQREALHFVITNSSQSPWPSGAEIDGKYQISVGNHWLDETGRVIVIDDGRSALPYDIEPGSKAEILLNVTAPAKPGIYVLEIDLVQEQVAWFAEKAGSKPLRLSVIVAENS